MIQTTLAKIALGCLILAACVLPSFSEDTTGAPTTAPTDFRCIGICGNDEGNLKDPELVVSYQWNLRVPVCSGLSCATGTCAALEEELSILDVTEFECARHRINLQDTAGCTCSKTKKRPAVQEDTISAATHNGILGAVLLSSVAYVCQVLL